jgi:subtilisin family serine protease
MKLDRGTLPDLDYGESYVQDSLINVPAVHNTGNYAQGVLIGMFDNGVRLPDHEAFDSLHIVATYDFVDHKVSVVPNNPDPSFGSHGVYTLSTIGGNKAGQLIGPAFGASYLLARTENDSSETPIEEDNWVAAMEWADSIGVDVTSTSLGYFNYEPPYESWTWEDMNGNTTVITRAADMAVARGIVVVNSAGNAGTNPDHNSLVAPADGDSVLSIGAVWSTGERANFSSVGPTTSIPPRIKPDVMAQGVNVYVASGINHDGYGTVSGTSLSCPLVAGVAALIIHARPDATPVEIADAMRNTASNADAPDNQYGWGIVDAMAAIGYLPVTAVEPQPGLATEFRLEQNYPNPFNPTTTIEFSIPSSAFVHLAIYNLLGERAATLVDRELPAGTHRVEWDAAGLQSGVYFCRLSAGKFTEVRKMILLR